MTIDEAVTRRGALGAMLGAALSWELARILSVDTILAGAGREAFERWSTRVAERCADLKRGSLSPVEWQSEVESLLSRISLKELLGYIDFDRMAEKMELPDLGVTTEKVKLPEVRPWPEGGAVITKLFGLRKGRAIIPHGHRNMASAHLVLSGEFDLRHFGKIEDQPGHLVIEPTIRKKASAGSVSSISDDKDNIHWFRTLSERAFTLDVIVVDLNGKRWDVQNIDPEAGARLGDGRIRAPKLGVREALEKYGKEVEG